MYKLDLSSKPEAADLVFQASFAESCFLLVISGRNDSLPST